MSRAALLDDLHELGSSLTLGRFLELDRAFSRGSSSFWISEPMSIPDE